MKKVFERWKFMPHEAIGIFFLLMLLSGLVVSRAMISMGIMGMVWNATFNCRIKENWKNFVNDKMLLLLTAIFFIYVFSGINSDNSHFWMERVKTKLPFLFLPFSFVVFKNIYARYLQLVLYAFAVFISSVCIYLAVIYLLNFDAVNDGYNQGHVMHLPYNHIRFSLMVSFCVVIFYYLHEQKIYFLSANEKWFQLFLAAFLIVFLHLIAVRSGLLALYLCVFYLALRRIFMGKVLLQSIATLIVFLSMPAIAYKVLPSFQHKINFVEYDLHTYFQQADMTGLSDGGRILSVKNGIELGKQNFWSGVGLGDLPMEMDKFYVHHPEIPGEVRLPHNQFVFVFAATGIFGLLLFVFCLFFPLFWKKNFKHILISSLFLILVSSCLTESTLEEQVGVGFSVSMILLLYFMKQNEPA